MLAARLIPPHFFSSTSAAWEEIAQQSHEDSQVVAFDLRHVGVAQGPHQDRLLRQTGIGTSRGHPKAMKIHGF